MFRLHAPCAAAFAASLLLACGGGGSGGKSDGKQQPIGPELSLTGRVTSAGQGGQGTPLAGASIHLSVDRDGNGRIGAGERVTVQSEADGTYAGEIVAGAGQTVVVSFESEGHAPIIRRVEGGGGAELVLNASLHQLEQLECAGARCAMENGRLSITGLAEGVTGAARVFNPVTETHYFPGGFDDSDGNLLISGVFSSVELRDEDGNHVDQLDEDVELRMQIPRDTWAVIVDLHPGNDRIDLPFYAFDEVLGTWVRHDQDGWLEDGNGEIVPESAADAIRSGDFEGALVATAKVNHFSYWNLDWPVESHACIAGVIRTESGAIAEGAVVTAAGVTYSGTSGSQIAGADGRFQLNVMRSEGADDVDQDGVPGETHSVSLRVVHGGRVYNLGQFDAPAEPGNGGEDCLELDLVLRPDQVVEAGLCTVRGTVLDHADDPMERVSVMVWDDSLPSEAIPQICGDGWQLCSFFADTAADGSFELTAAVMDNPTVWASTTWKDGAVESYRWANLSFPGGCPTAPLQIRLTEGWDILEFALSTGGEAFSWEPAQPITYLIVSDAEGMPKWSLVAEEEGNFDGPVRYGEVPAGAMQTMPWDGTAPAALASGDVVTIYATNWSTTGVVQMGTGTGVVP